MSATTALHATPIDSRPPHGSTLLGILFVVIFDAGILLINFTQYLFLPLLLFPTSRARELYESGVCYTKAAFGTLCVLICQWFAPTKFIVTCEGNARAEEIVVRDPITGQVTELRLPPKLVIIANHQIYADWLYIWCLTYFMKSHGQVLIILKKSLKWIPFVGWGMQLYRFMFLTRSWAADRMYLGRHLDKLAKRAQASGEPFSLMVFPEGTLVSANTRPLSKKYADKMGIPDMTNQLLPRSTGLFFVLRTLNPPIANLQLLDITIAYPGIPRAGFGQSYYTLRSIFMKGVPPPAIHIHLRLYDVDRDVPLGNVGKGVGRGAEATPEEAKVFDEWLRQRWIEKDLLLDGFRQNGAFTTLGASGAIESKSNGHKPNGNGNGIGEKDKPVEIPVRLRSKLEILNAFGFFAPVLVYFLFSRIKSFFFEGHAAQVS